MRRAIEWAAVLLIVATAAHADDFRPRVMIGWESRESGGVTTTRLRQDVDLFLSRALTDSITLRLNLGANHYDLAMEHPDLGAAPNVRALEVRPSGSLLAVFGPVATETDYALRRSRFDTADGRRERETEQLGTRIGWASTRFLPGASLRASRYRLSDGASQGAPDAEIVNDLAQGTLEYRAGGLSLSAGQGLRVDRDDRLGYERTTNDQVAGLTFADTFAGGRLSVSAAATGMRSQVDDTAGRASLVPTYVPPARALWSVDDTPLDSNDHPFSAYPSLHDGRIGVSTGISLGPDSVSFQAIAFDIGRVSPVDEIQVVVRDERLDPVTAPGGVEWDVYTSEDGIRWVPHTAGLEVRFESVRSQYEISFEQVDVRWIKIVNFGVAAQQVLVTEAYVVFHTKVTAGSRDSEFSTLASSAAITFTPVRSVTLGYTGSMYETSQQAGSSLQSDVRDLLHLVSARYDPSGRWGYEARYEMRDAATDRQSQRSRALSGAVRFMPRPQISSSLLCEVRSEVIDERLLDGRLCAAQVSARVFPTLDVSVGGSGREQQLDGGGTLRTRTLYASSTARVTPSLRVALSGSMNRSETAEWTGSLLPPAQDDRFTADVDWNRGRALGLGATFGWVRGDTFSGLVQRYRLRWTPFGDGSISLSTNYTQDIDPYSNSVSRRLLFSPRWQVNPRTALNVTYSSVSTSGDQDFESKSILAALIFGR